MTKAIELSQLGSNITVNGDNIGIGTAAPAGTLHLADDACAIFLQETDASADNGIWAYSANSEELVWQARNDALGGGGNLFKMTRTGNSIDTFEAQKSAITWLIADNTTRRVGIGTNSPGQLLDLQSSDPRINITDTDAGGIFQIRNTSGAGYLTTLGEHPLLFYTNSSESMRINSNGNVGIGTNNPVSKLEVRNSGDGAALLRFNFDRSWTVRQRGTGSGSSLSLQSEVGNKYFNIENVNQEINLRMYAATDKTAGAFVVGEDSTRVPGIDLQNGYILVGTATYGNNQNKPILIAGATTWDGTTTNWGTYGLQMRLKSDGSGVPRLTIDGNGGEFICVENGGNVGIGTNNPAAKLHIQGTSIQNAGAFADNITYGGRTFTANHDIQATSMRGGILVRNMNDYRSETPAASFMHYDAYTTTATSYAFRAARGATLSDTFWVKSDGSMYAASTFSGNSISLTSNITQTSNAPQHIFKETGTTYGTTNWALVRDGDSFSIRWNNAAPYAFRAGTSGGAVSSVFLRGNGLEVNASGTVIAGSLSKGSGSFRIQHPLDELSETTDLVHSFVEAPDASNLYAGMVQLTDGVAVVNIDTAHRMTEGTFVALNHVQSWSSSNESGYAPVKCSISGNLLTIECQDTSSTDTVYYEVRGIRKDQHMIDTDWTDGNGRVITEPPKRAVPE
jgi:hypothetical protein